MPGLILVCLLCLLAGAQLVRVSQGKGLMPDNTSRFSCKGQKVAHCEYPRLLLVSCFVAGFCRRWCEFPVAWLVRILPSPQLGLLTFEGLLGLRLKCTHDASILADMGCSTFSEYTVVNE